MWSEASVLRLVAATSDSIAIVDRDLRFRAVSPAYRTLFLRLYGAVPEVGTLLPDALADEVVATRAAVLAGFAAALRGEEVTQEWFGGEVGGGRYSSVIEALTDDAGAVVGAVETLRPLSGLGFDLDDGQLGELIDISPALVAVSRLDDRRLLYANRACLAFYGIDPDATSGFDMRDIHVQPGDRAAFIERLRREGSVQGIEFKVRRADGEIRVLQGSARGVRFAGTPAALVVVHDITERVEMEDATREHARRWRRLMDKMPAGAVLLNQAGVLANRAAETITGYAAGDADTVDEWIRLLFDDEAEGARQELQRLRRHGLMPPRVAMLKRRDGEQRFVELSGTADGDEMVLMLSDVTERRRGEQALARSEALYRTIVETSQAGICVLDTASLLVFANQRMSALLDRSLGALIATSPLAFIHPKERLRAAAQLADNSQGRSDVQDYRLLRADGEIVWVRLTSSPLYDRQGEVTAILVLIDDIDRRKRAELALARETRRVSAILASMFDGVVVTDGHGLIDSFNPAAEKLFGYGADEISGQPLTALVPGLRLLARRGEDGVVMGQRKDGAQLPLEVAIAPIQSDDHDTAEGPPAYVVVVRDVAERIRSQNELITAKIQAEGANRAKTNFLANMSHELRTPLNAIIGFSEMIERQVLGENGWPRYIEYSRHIHRSGTHLLALINDVLDLSKIEAGRYELTDEVMALAELLDACHTMVMGRAEAEGLQVVVSLPETGLSLRGDRRALTQILLNLLTNAVKYNAQGGSVAVAASRRADGAVDLVIRDSGPGIAPGEIDRLFQPFQRTDAALARSVEGTGLGLSITKRLVELHDGEIHLASRLGEGTTVTVTWPASRVVAAERALPDLTGRP
jgi:PAS domain S-box-containing protein